MDTQTPIEALLNSLPAVDRAHVAHADTSWLCEGDEYIDLDDVWRGVQRARGTTGLVRHRILARRAVREATWRRIMAQLGTARGTTRGASPH